MAILTLTRQAGSLGDEIGMLIARRLGYTFYDFKEIERRIIEKGLPKDELLKYDERKPCFFDSFRKTRDKYLNYLSMVILEIAKKNNCVIMGRGAFLFLRNMPNHLAVRFFSTHQERIKHIKEQAHIESDKLAEKMLKKYDKKQHEFYKSCFRYDLKDNSFIQILINTSMLDPEITADMIVGGIKNSMTPEVEKQADIRIEELILAQKISNTLIFEHNLSIDELWVLVHGNVITLTGMTAFHATVERAITIINSEWGGYQIRDQIKCVQDSLLPKL